MFKNNLMKGKTHEVKQFLLLAVTLFVLGASEVTHEKIYFPSNAKVKSMTK